MQGSSIPSHDYHASSNIPRTQDSIRQSPSHTNKGMNRLLYGPLLTDPSLVLFHQVGPLAAVVAVAASPLPLNAQALGLHMVVGSQHVGTVESSMTVHSTGVTPAPFLKRQPTRLISRHCHSPSIV